MTKKIFRAIMLVAAAVLLASLLIIMGCLYDYFGNVQEDQLTDEAELAAAGLTTSGVAYLDELKSERYRVTWVAADGTVLYDTKNDATAMDNHGDREEIREALASGQGQSTRYSSTLLEKTIYSAKLLADGTVLRVSISRATAGALAFGMLRPLLVVLIVALILALLLAGRVARHIVRPLNDLNLDQPLENDTYDELSPLLGRLHRQQQEISSQLQRLQRQRDEFNQITGNMQEALVVLDSRGAVVSLNPTARRLFGADNACLGGDFLAIERDPAVSRAVATAMDEGHSEIRVERGESRYQFDVSRIESDGAVIGGVLLAFDVTQQELAERNRREFTANVSHELKTPLQTIIGSAELLANDMVRPEDRARFAGRIRQEATKLVTLIEDVIRLSQLDEGGELPLTDVPLLELAEEVAVALNDRAEAKGLRLTVSGEEVVAPGARPLLYEVLYNLCDNAIKYTMEGGSVELAISAEEKTAVITVRDTGAGIPPEQQGRVFERFYRVDKSHSNASDGTGLGLSIVKHAVSRHHGTVALQSAVGRGTTVTVTLPRS